MKKMAKAIRNFSIDIDLIEKLRTVNASELVNNFLREYFRKEDINQMNKEEIKLAIEKEKARINYEEKLREIEQNETE